MSRNMTDGDIRLNGAQIAMFEPQVWDYRQSCMMPMTTLLRMLVLWLMKDERRFRCHSGVFKAELHKVFGSAV